MSVGRAQGVELEDLQTGEVRRVTARWVVVAADALRTPQLLWASGIRPAALGRYLNDQPQVIAAVRLDDELSVVTRRRPGRPAAVRPAPPSTAA